MNRYEYKVNEAKNSREAEIIMNQMANEGWRVISTILWSNMAIRIVITFEREIVDQFSR